MTLAVLAPLAALLPVALQRGARGTATPRPSCGADSAAAAADLRAINERTRAAHFTRDAGAFLAAWADTVLDVRGGSLRPAARDALRAPLREQWRALTFDEVSDLTPPVVRVSPDGCMAWLAGHVRVRAREATPAGERPLRLDAAWLAVFERGPGGAWRQVAIANTDASR
ncbi:MAG TPA: hypothetical protein VNA89_00010 [Gemmatimonadaceae bacterium]|nr:hypothetical protein [Gemmatimonadaceae bacterium]